MHERGFRLAFAVLGLTAFSVSTGFRLRADKLGGRMSRGSEHPCVRTALSAAGILMLLIAALYVLRPTWLRWSQVPLPASLRWLAVGVATLCLPLLTWVLGTLGQNITPTVTTRSQHSLVVTGPYRWVRHPLYTVSLIFWASLGVIAANGLMLVLLAGAFVVLVIRTPAEEARLLERFGEVYQTYCERTGRFLPHSW
ncbi:MAG: isoprenylcysteine carboxylmethyltransferase family protein [Chloroflexi bacterium]|nr:isoprenylcysteine carboxylmethyltransferase family protein [Chloroflexota bacterium]